MAANTPARSERMRVSTLICCAPRPIRTLSWQTKRRSPVSRSKKSPGTYELATTQEHFSIEGRGLVREATLEHYRADEEFVKKIAGDEELPHDPAFALYPPETRFTTAVGDDGRSQHVHRLQRLCHCLPGGKQHPDRRQIAGQPRPRHALDSDRSLLRERQALQPGQRRVAGESGDGARADDVPALRKCAVRNSLSGQRHCPQREWAQRHGLQPLHRHAVLREQLPVQGAPL